MTLFSVADLRVERWGAILLQDIAFSVEPGQVLAVIGPRTVTLARTCSAMEPRSRTSTSPTGTIPKVLAVP